MHIQFGCGYSAPRNWRNFDSSITLRLQRLPVIGWLVRRKRAAFPSNVEYGDVVRKLPIADNSCDGIYASHVLEHLTRSEIELALAETHRILKPNGRFRLVVPDLEVAVADYIKDIKEGSIDASDNFNGPNTLLGKVKRPRKLKEIAHEVLATSAHMWMWDYQSLAGLLQKHGFKSIRRASFNDSDDDAFLSVEEEKRFFRSVAIDCTK